MTTAFRESLARLRLELPTPEECEAAYQAGLTAEDSIGKAAEGGVGTLDMVGLTNQGAILIAEASLTAEACSGHAAEGSTAQGAVSHQGLQRQRRSACAHAQS